MKTVDFLAVVDFSVKIEIRDYNTHKLLYAGEKFDSPCIVGDVAGVFTRGGVLVVEIL